MLLVVFVGLSIKVPLSSIKLTASHSNAAEASHGCCSDCCVFFVVSVGNLRFLALFEAAAFPHILFHTFPFSRTLNVSRQYHLKGLPHFAFHLLKGLDSPSSLILT